MRAVVLHAARDLRYEEVGDAPTPGAGEVTIAVRACGICGTDVHEYLNAPVLTPLETRHPSSGHLGAVIIGHEFVGVISALGNDVPETMLGRRVAAGAAIWCGHCRACRDERFNLCEAYRTAGIQRDGGLAESVTVPVTMCVELPESLDDVTAALAQPLAVATHAVRRARARPGDHVIVQGGGAIGSLVLAVLVDAGIRVTVIDISPARLDAALRLGAHAVEAPDSAAAGSADVVFETSGAPGALDAAIRLAHRGGRVVAVGLPAGRVEFDMRSAVIGERDIIGSNAHVSPVDLPDAVALLQRHRGIGELIGTVVGLSEAPAAIDALGRGQLPGKLVVTVP